MSRSNIIYSATFSCINNNTKWGICVKSTATCSIHLIILESVKKNYTHVIAHHCAPTILNQFFQLKWLSMDSSLLERKSHSCHGKVLYWHYSSRSFRFVLQSQGPCSEVETFLNPPKIMNSQPMKWVSPNTN